ncbi:hypothetical protein CCHR01_08321 [Colletotrichum chrysophilum]|uniref:Uncharacterized protein n=1 Tax=Colletotrichum chrysophilum TaxID=1836956 RepID=A0AAD9ALR5_9PEZI|nr:hypothetical protein CCHR01_08321 [Colletotrichum chrysophilum]
MLSSEAPLESTVTPAGSLKIASRGFPCAAFGERAAPTLVQPEDYINDEHGRLAKFNETLAVREVYLNPKPAAAALLQHVRIIRINGIHSILDNYCPEEIRCIGSLPALEIIQASHGSGDARRFPPLPENSEDRHRHGELIHIDESMYPYAAIAAEQDPFGLEHLWGSYSSALVQTPEGLMIRFIDRECRCYLDTVETERKWMMEEMGFGSLWYISLPREMSSNFPILCLREREEYD